jgi:glycosyltransferase involved in cell wall biosynthesis
MLKVCILAPYKVLPTLDGAARRVMEISIGLADKGVSVTLLHAGTSGSYQNKIQMVGFPALENLPLTKTFLWSRALDAYVASGNPALLNVFVRLIRKTTSNIVQIEGPWSIFAVKLAAELSDKPVVVYDAHNVESLATRFSSGVRWMWPYTAFLEKQAVKRSDAVFCVSELDKARMCSLYRLPSSNIFIVPNGVCHSRYREASGSQIRKRLGLSMNMKIVFFHGLLSWKPNFEAAQTILESISTHFEGDNQEIVFLIAGSHPPKSLLNHVKQRTNVKILGYVPNIEEYICAADVCIAPLKTGSGTKLKILEYLAAGKPVVATRKAVEGMKVRHGKEAIVLDDVGERFICAIEDALSLKGSSRLVDYTEDLTEPLEWMTVATKIKGIYESLLN